MSIKTVTVPAIVGVVALAVGFIAGAGGSTATPASTVTATVKAPVTPASCIAALDSADQLIGWAGDVSSIYADLFGGPLQDAITAAAAWDADGISAATDEITTASGQVDAITAKVNDSDYASERDECKAAGK